MNLVTFLLILTLWVVIGFAVTGTLTNFNNAQFSSITAHPITSESATVKPLRPQLRYRTGIPGLGRTLCYSPRGRGCRVAGIGPSPTTSYISPQCYKEICVFIPCPSSALMAESSPLPNTLRAGMRPRHQQTQSHQWCYHRHQEVLAGTQCAVTHH